LGNHGRATNPKNRGRPGWFRRRRFNGGGVSLWLANSLRSETGFSARSIIVRPFKRAGSGHQSNLGGEVVINSGGNNDWGNATRGQASEGQGRYSSGGSICVRTAGNQGPERRLRRGHLGRPGWGAVLLGSMGGLVIPRAKPNSFGILEDAKGLKRRGLDYPVRRAVARAG